MPAKRSPGSRTERPRTARQEEIIDAAMALVREEGWPNLTVRRLAERLGVTDPALYRHFATKGEIALGLADRLEGMLHVPVRTLAADVARSPFARLREILAHHVGLVLAVDGLPLLLVAEAFAGGDTALQQRLSGLLGEYLGILVGLLGELRQPPDPPAEDLALLVLGLPAVLAIRCRVFPQAPMAPERAGALVQVALERLFPHAAAGGAR
jgi:TetR/AcrR family transcriptional regulator